MENQYNIRPIQKVRVSDEVFEQMKKNIILHIWSAGSKIPSEHQLAELFGVSRVTIRASIQRLVAIGLAETRNGDGTYVVETKSSAPMLQLMQDMTLNPADIFELLEFRLGVETLSCSLAAQRRSDAQLRELHGYLEEMDAAALQSDVKAYSKADVRFHKCIAEMSHNSVIQSVLNILEDFMFSYIMETNESMGVELGRAYHGKVYEAIRLGDADTAKALIEENVRKSMEGVEQIKHK